MQELKVDEKELEKRVKHVVSLSKEIPWYVRKYKELGIDPDEIRSPQDLLKAYEKGLYTTPQDLPELVYYKHPEAKEFLTSGTTGKPKKIGFNPDDDKRGESQGIKLFGNILKKDDRVLNCFPKEPAISSYGSTLGLSALGVNFQNLPAQEIGKDLSKFIDKLKEYKPTALLGLTTFVYRLPLLLEKFNISKKDIFLQRIFCAGEPSSIERRKTISNELQSDVFDIYASAENGFIGYEYLPLTDEHLIIYPETLLFLVKEKNEVSTNEIGDVILTNLHPAHLTKPYMVLLNYKIGDWAKCVEKEDNGIVTSISEIRREAAYLSGAKLHPQEVEKAIEELEDYKKELTGEYTIIDFKTIPREVVYAFIRQGIELDEDLLEKLRNDPNMYKNWDRKSEVEIRVESMYKLSSEKNEEINKKIREKLYASNIPVKTLVEIIGDARLFIEAEDPGELYKDFRKLIKSGKPKRLIVV